MKSSGLFLAFEVFGSDQAREECAAGALHFGPPGASGVPPEACDVIAAIAAIVRVKIPLREQTLNPHPHAFLWHFILLKFML